MHAVLQRVIPFQIKNEVVKIGIKELKSLYLMKSFSKKPFDVVWEKR